LRFLGCNKGLHIFPFLSLVVNLFFEFLVLASYDLELLFVGITAGCEFLFNQLFIHVLGFLLCMFQVQLVLLLRDFEPLSQLFHLAFKGCNLARLITLGLGLSLWLFSLEEFLSCIDVPFRTLSSLSHLAFILCGLLSNFFWCFSVRSFFRHPIGRGCCGRCVLGLFCICFFWLLFLFGLASWNLPEHNPSVHRSLASSEAPPFESVWLNDVLEIWVLVKGRQVDLLLLDPSVLSDFWEVQFSDLSSFALRCR